MTIFWEKGWGGDSIQGRALYKGGHYSRKYGMWNTLNTNFYIQPLFLVATAE